MEIIFFLILAGALIYAVGYSVVKFFTSPGTIERNDGAIGSVQNEGQFFDGPDGYDATGGYQESRES